MKLNFHPSCLTPMLSQQATGTFQAAWKSFTPETFSTSSLPGANVPTSQTRDEAIQSFMETARKQPRQRRIYNVSERALAAEMMLKLKRGEDMRINKIANVRQALMNDVYENNLKLDIAVDKLLSELEGESQS